MESDLKTIPPALTFVSIFVRDVGAATQRYTRLFGVEPTLAHSAPLVHPFGDSPPVVFDLGNVAFALYECAPNRGTQAGDVGFGIDFGVPLEDMSTRANQVGARVFRAPGPLQEDDRRMSVFVTPDRHFFEAVEPIKR